jgi:SAM-dependent methyltransferase
VDLIDASAWVLRWAVQVGAGPVLDLACGEGRHSRVFAAQGREVLAVDRSAAALSALAGVHGVRTLQADLENGSPWPLAGQRFAAVLVTNYLHRPLFPLIQASLSPGGMLIYETFMLGNERFGKPSNPDFLLQAGELWTAFGAELEVRAFEQGFQAQPKPAMIQRLCAIFR